MEGLPSRHHPKLNHCTVLTSITTRDSQQGEHLPLVLLYPLEVFWLLYFFILRNRMLSFWVCYDQQYLQLHRHIYIDINLTVILKFQSPSTHLPSNISTFPFRKYPLLILHEWKYPIYPHCTSVQIAPAFPLR